MFTMVLFQSRCMLQYQMVIAAQLFLAAMPDGHNPQSCNTLPVHACFQDCYMPPWQMVSTFNMFKVIASGHFMFRTCPSVGREEKTRASRLKGLHQPQTSQKALQLHLQWHISNLKVCAWENNPFELSDICPFPADLPVILIHFDLMHPHLNASQFSWGDKLIRKKAQEGPYYLSFLLSI